MALQQLGRTTLGTAVAYKVAKGGLKRGSLNRDGAVAAFTVAALAFSCSFRSGITLLCFYKTGSMLTKYGAAVKQKLEDDYVAGEGQRGAGQVLACSAIAVACALMRRVFVGTDGPLSLGVGELECLGNRLTLAFVAFFGCCAGDTYASELGILSKAPPRLVTKPWKVAKPGTNGGISALGTVASAAGGIAMGLCHALFIFPPSLREVAALVYQASLAGARRVAGRLITRSDRASQLLLFGEAEDREEAYRDDDTRLGHPAPLERDGQLRLDGARRVCRIRGAATTPPPLRYVTQS